MNKGEFTEALASRVDVSKAEADRIINAFTDLITEQLQKDGDVSLTGFGTFSVTERAARQGYNPQTGEKMQIPATKTPKFKAGKGLKDAVKGGGGSSENSDSGDENNGF